VDRPVELQTTGLGAAFLAGLGVGIWTSTDELASTRRSSGVFEPGSIDQVAHERWREAVARSRRWSA
jgi:glycerol kinase